MLVCEVDLNRSADIGLLCEHGPAIREVSIERGECGNYFLSCLNEFSGDAVVLGEIKSSASVFAAMNEWLDFLHKDDFMALYLHDYGVVIVDYYHPVGKQ